MQQIYFSASSSNHIIWTPTNSRTRLGDSGKLPKKVQVEYIRQFTDEKRNVTVEYLRKLSLTHARFHNGV